MTGNPSGPGFSVNPQALAAVEAGLTAVMNELNTLGLNGEQSSGQAIEDLGLSDEQMGSSSFGLSATYTELLGRAHFVARGTLNDTQTMVDGLTKTRTNYQQVEQGVTSMFQKLVGDPLPAAPRAGTTITPTTAPNAAGQPTGAPAEPPAPTSGGGAGRR